MCYHNTCLVEISHDYIGSLSIFFSCSPKFDDNVIYFYYLPITWFLSNHTTFAYSVFILNTNRFLIIIITLLRLIILFYIIYLVIYENILACKNNYFID